MAGQERQWQVENHRAGRHDRSLGRYRPQERLRRFHRQALAVHHPASQSGDFARDKGRQVAETLLQAHPDADIIYAHNDEMALGAIAALEAAGKTPGKDVLILSIDGEKEGVQAIIDGKIGAICACSPLFGPKAFATMADYAAGKKIPPFIKNEDAFFDATNAKKDFDIAF
ncbi:substrate-binding domain-containing protein [Mesorhizobium sp. M0478]|uniref:substrate-binding domain-containing protein n=1 Tax=Mesorhizobium sp. M0478 TaxID=2956947 RepID=UPI0033392ED8